jgi:predicted flavoprotein YhiN
MPPITVPNGCRPTWESSRRPRWWSPPAACRSLVSCNGESFRENILFTDPGLSGPAILQISSFWHLGDAVEINLF